MTTTKLFDHLRGVLDDFLNWAPVSMILAIIVIILIVVGIAAGAGVLSTLFLFLLVGISLFFGSVRFLAGSALLTVLLQTAGDSTHRLLSPWLGGEKLDMFFQVTKELPTSQLFLAIFTITYLLSFVTGSIKLVHFNNNVEVKRKEKKKDEENK